MALSPVSNNRPHRKPSILSQEDSSMDIMRLCIRENIGPLFGTARKCEISISIIFSKHGTTGDVEEFVSSIINVTDMSQDRKHLQGCIQRCITNSCLDLYGEKPFDTVCRQFMSIWSLLVRATGPNRECVCKLFLSALIQSIQLVCTTIGDSFRILQHYVVYERLGTLSKILRTCVNQVYSPATNAQQISSFEHQRYSGEWVIRAIGGQSFLINVLKFTS